MHEFETGPTTDDHRPSRRRNLPIQHESAHHLVDGIVTTDIFSGQHDGTIGIQHAGCVHRAVVSNSSCIDRKPSGPAANAPH